MSNSKKTRDEILVELEEAHQRIAKLDASLEFNKRKLAIMQSLDGSDNIKLEDLFNLDDIQRLQDEFANATGVASIITHPDGTPITAPSNFCLLCRDIIRNTEKGLSNCIHSDAIIGKFSAVGPTIQQCMSGGLWDAGAGISIAGRHIANWLIGQVRDETQSEEQMREYAREIGADETAVVTAFREVPAMSRERLGQVAQFLFTLANQLSTTAFQNVLQSRSVFERKQAAVQSAKAAEFYMTILNRAPVLIWRAGLDAKCDWFNATWLSFTGRDLSQEKGDGWTEGVYPEDFSDCLKTYMAAFHAKEFFEMEYRLRRHDGEYRWIVDFGCPFETLEGEFGGYIGYCYDITERKRAEDALKQSERYLRSTLDGLSANIALLDEQGNVQLVNKAWRDFAYANGLSSETVSEGSNYLHACDAAAGNNAEEAAPFAEGIRIVLSGKKDSFIMEYPCHAPNKKRWFTGRVTLFPDNEGPRHVVVAHEDITKRKQAERVLQKERDFSNAVVRMVGSLVIVLDREGRIERFNQACEDTTGYSFEEIKGQVFWDFLMTSDESRSIKKVFERLTADDFPSTNENFLVIKGGSKRLIAWNNTALIGDDGQVEHIISTGTDITEQRSTEYFREREMHTLEEMGAPIPAGVTASTLGLKSLRESEPKLLAKMTDRFADLLDQAVEMLAVKVEYDIQKSVREISETLGAMRAGPRDVMDVFLEALKTKCAGASPEKCQAYREEGRIMLIELIGKLAVYYRNHCLGMAFPAMTPATRENGGRQ